MKSYAKILASIDSEFEKALSALCSDPLFSSEQTLYTDDDKRRIAEYWWDLVSPFIELRKIIRRLYWRSFFTFGSKNSFVVKYAAIVTYYNKVYELRDSFGRHEEFIRQYLDDTFSENYSTLARYMYHIRFYAVLSYPYEYFLILRDEVHPSLSPLFDRRKKHAWMVENRWRLDIINIWYYIRYRISLLLTWISRHGGRLMMHIHLTRRKQGLISSESLSALRDALAPWDILVTRGNWAATNLNIPGFWKHMAIYIWTGKYLWTHFSSLEYLEFEDEVHYIIEAIGNGVRIIPIELLASHNDYIGALRPRFGEDKIYRAIAKTLSLYGKSYDYSFNFYSDMNYVCSTLVTKSYLPESSEDEWIHITLTRIGISITYPPNDIVKKYHSEYGSDIRELDFVGFIDALEKTEKSFLGSEEAFRFSGFRSKLSFFLP